MRKGFALLICLLLFAPVQASAKKNDLSSESTAFITTLAGEVTAFLAQPGLSDAEMEKKFTSILKANFDITRIGRFALGTYWRDATPEQQKEYLKLFEKFIVLTYVERFKSYSGEQIRVNGAEVKDRYAIVRSLVNDPKNRTDILVDWRVRRDDNGKLKVVDVAVEGVSLSLAQRDEFAAVIQGGGGKIDALLDALRNRRVQVSNSQKR